MEKSSGKNAGQLSSKELLWLMLISNKLDTCESDADIRSVASTAANDVEILAKLSPDRLDSTTRTYMLSVFGGRH